MQSAYHTQLFVEYKWIPLSNMSLYRNPQYISLIPNLHSSMFHGDVTFLSHDSSNIRPNIKASCGFASGLSRTNLWAIWRLYSQQSLFKSILFKYWDQVPSLCKLKAREKREEVTHPRTESICCIKATSKFMKNEGLRTKDPFDSWQTQWVDYVRSLEVWGLSPATTQLVSIIASLDANFLTSNVTLLDWMISSTHYTKIFLISNLNKLQDPNFNSTE